MKKPGRCGWCNLLLGSLLLVMLPKIAAALVFVTDEDVGRKHFLDAANMNRKGYIVYIWQVQINEQVDQAGAMMIRSQQEFDCRFRQSRVMWLTSYADKDGVEAPLQSSAVQHPQWVPVTSGSVTEKLLDQACGMIMR